MEESVGFWKLLSEMMGLQEADPNGYSPLVLAYIGDAVYELVIRTRVIADGNVQVNKLHKHTTSFVSAGAQAQLFFAIRDSLTEEEFAVYRRGRNAKSGSTAKNATIREYRIATGFEALIGWLYLTDQEERLFALIKQGLTKRSQAEENTYEI